MSDQDVAFLTVVVGVTVLIIVIEQLRRRRPCWMYGHSMNHLSIDKRTWTNGACDRGNHRYHGSHTTCYITKWVCARPGCGSMGFYCAGEAVKGAWTIQHGKIVPDEKEWSQWK